MKLIKDFLISCINVMSEIPESFEVLLYYLQTLVEAAGEAQTDETASMAYMNMVEELSQNTVRLFGILSIIASVIYRIATDTAGFKLEIGDHEPEEYEVFLVNWVEAARTMDSEKISELSTGLAECSSDMIEGFIFLLLSFYLNLMG